MSKPMLCRAVVSCGNSTSMPFNRLLAKNESVSGNADVAAGEGKRTLTLRKPPEEAESDTNHDRLLYRFRGAVSRARFLQEQESDKKTTG